MHFELDSREDCREREESGAVEADVLWEKKTKDKKTFSAYQLARRQCACDLIGWNFVSSQ